MKFHMWKVARGRLLTNQGKGSWFSSSSDCVHCAGVLETVLHVHRDCPIASHVWLPLVRSSCLQRFHGSDLLSLIHDNMSSNMGMENCIDRATMLMTGCFYLCSWHNKESFDEDFSRPFWSSLWVGGPEECS